MKRVLIVFAIFVMVCCLASCGGKGTVEYIDPDEVERVLPADIRKMIESGRYDEDLVQILQAAASRELPESTYDKIHRAFLDGEIDRETEVLLTLQAAYSPQELLKKYAGPKYKDGKGSLRSELQWLINHHHQLDPKTQATVMPFVLSPKDPGSYFHPAFAGDKNILKNLALVKTAHAAETDWSTMSVFISGVSHNVTLYYREQGLPVNKQLEIELQVHEIIDALNKAWPMFTELLGVHLTRDLEIFLTDQMAEDLNGEALYYTTGSNISKYEIRLNESGTGGDLQSTTAHELFHCFQFEMGLTWYDVSSDLDWLTEATAVWAEHFVYQENSTEHQYLEEYFYNLDHDRLSTTGTQEYGSYMLFFFLTDFLSNRGYVPDILWAASAVKDTMDIRGMLMRVIDDIKENYGRFALCNWNLPPAKYYADTPSFPDPRRAKPEDCIPSGSSMTYHRVQTREKNRYEDFLTPGGMVYRVFHFDAPPEEIEKVRFDFREENPNLQWVKRQALIRIGDTWLPEAEDWTGLEYRDFCRKEAHEKVTAVVLILSNAGLGALDGTPHTCVVDTEGKCADLKGFVRMRMELPQIIESEKMTIIEWAELYSEDELVYCSECNRYVLKKRDITYSALRYVKNVYLDESGGILGMVEYTREDSGNLSEEYEPAEKFTRLFVLDDGKTVRLSGLPDTMADIWVTVTEISVEENFGVRSQSETSKTSTLIYPTFDDIWSEDFEAGSKSYTRRDGFLGVTVINDTCEITDEYIAGTRTVQTASGSITTLEFKFRFITPPVTLIE